MRPPDLFACHFGDGSFAEHKTRAEQAGATVQVFRSERLMLDLDTPEDLREYLQLCQQYGIEPFVDLSLEDLQPFFTT